MVRKAKIAKKGQIKLGLFTTLELTYIICKKVDYVLTMLDTGYKMLKIQSTGSCIREYRRIPNKNKNYINIKVLEEKYQWLLQ